MTEVTGKVRRKADNKKLTRVLSTKLSIDDYNCFVVYSKTAHAKGIIDEPTPFRFLRYITSDLISTSEKVNIDLKKEERSLKKKVIRYSQNPLIDLMSLLMVSVSKCLSDSTLPL